MNHFTIMIKDFIYCSMVQLATKQERDLIGINNYERAIIYSACLLLSANSAEYDRNFLIVPDSATNIITVRLNLPLDMVKYWASAGDPYYSLESVSDLTPVYENDYLGGGGLFDEPSEVNSLEKYYVWAMQELKKLKPLTQENITVDLRRQRLNTSVGIAYSPTIYRNTSNLLASVVGAPIGVIASGQLSNDTQLNNNNQLIN